MDVEFSLTPEDLIAFQRYHRRRPPVTPQPQLDLPRLLFWVVVGGVLFAFLSVRTFIPVPLFDNLFAAFPGVGVGAILALVIFQIYIKLTASGATRRALRRGRNAEKVLGWRRISIDARALRVETEYSALTYLWWAVDAITVSPDYAFIYFMTNNAFIVPRDAFPTDRAFDAFVEAARRYYSTAPIGEGGNQERRPPTARRAADEPGGQAADDRIARKEGGG